MFAQLFARPSAMRRQRPRSKYTLRTAAVAALTLLAAACSAVSRPIASADPSDPTARVPALTYRPVVGGYVSRRPVEPASWREQNERVTPPAKE